MHRRSALLAIAVAVASGCSRDLEVPPPPSSQAVGVVPASWTVAPRQSYQFAAAGGAGGYVFDFAPGGKLSGLDASIDPDGLYTAGSNGSAQDVILVTDAAGAEAFATVTVLAHIAISPSFSGATPGGLVSFQKTGGGAGFTFELLQSPSGGTIDPVTGRYLAGPTGDVTDTVRVVDEFGTWAKAEVRVGAALQLYRAGTSAVAPRESVTIAAWGGQSPYTFSVDGPGLDPANDPTVDAKTGVFLAGTRANDPDPYSVTTVAVRVTDSAAVPQTTAMVIPIGPRLRLELGSTQVFPGQTAQLTATGGKPPYTFGFAARAPANAADPSTDPLRTSGGNGGNRSRGTVNALSGEYVPGFSPGAVDFFQVTDGTGAPAALLEGPPVSGVTYAIGTGTRRCLAGDFNGDGSGDVAFASKGDGGGSNGKFVVAELLDTPEPFLQGYFLQRDALGPSVAVQTGGIGRDRLLMVGGDVSCKDGARCIASDLWSLTPNLAGYLEQRQELGGGDDPDGWTTVLNDPAHQDGTGTRFHQETTNYGIQLGAARHDAAKKTWRVYAPARISDTIPSATWSPGQNVCGNVWGEKDATVGRFDWPEGQASPSRPVCIVVRGFCPGCTWTGDPSTSVHYGPLAAAVGDFDGNGKTDLAWILGTEQNGRIARGAQGAALRIAYGSASADPDGAATVTLSSGAQGWAGAGWDFALSESSAFDTRLLVLHPTPGSPPGTPDQLLIRLQDSAGRGKLFLVRNPLDWSQQLDPDPSGPGVDGVAAYAPSPTAPASFVSWTGNDGVVTGFGVKFYDAAQPAIFITPPSVAATFPFAVNAACTPDVNGDGAPDLVAASNLGGAAELVIGDGTVGVSASGTFGRQAHLRGAEFPVAVGDLDGDGFGDAVVGTAGSGLSVLWGGGGQLAWGRQLTSKAVGAVLLGDFYGDGQRSILFQEKSGAYGRIRNRGGGTFDPAVAISAFAAIGGAPSASFFVWPVRLGTSAPGPDAFTIQKDGGIAALLVQNGRVVEVRPKPFPALSALWDNVETCWGTGVGDDQPRVVAGCSYGNSHGASGGAVALFGATISNPDGPAPAFSEWVLLTTTAATWNGGQPNPFVQAPPAGARATIARVGTGTTADRSAPIPLGKALFLMGTDRMYGVEVAYDPGTTKWSLAAVPVTLPYGSLETSTRGQPFIAAAGVMDTDAGNLYVVAGGDDGTNVVRRTSAGAWELVQKLSLMGFPMGVTPLGVVSQGGTTVRSPGDAVMFIGDFSNTGLTPEIVPRLNGGTGELR